MSARPLPADNPDPPPASDEEGDHEGSDEEQLKAQVTELSTLRTKNAAEISTLRTENAAQKREIQELKRAR